jgi:hypothetical protein
MRDYSAYNGGSATALDGHTRVADGLSNNRLTERRKTRRAPLRWTAYVAAPHATHPFRTEIRDISMGGLYCVVNRPVTPGERIECDIVLPTYTSLESSSTVFLRCRAHVVRVEETALPNHFGIGCTIEDYRLVRVRADEPTPAGKAGSGF